MKKEYIIGLFLLIFFLLAMVSNPSKSDYVSWVKEGIQEEEGVFIGLISGPFLNSYTTKKDFIIFTVYSTSFGEKESEKLVAVGILNNFIWLKGISEESK
ncbi:DUF4359 domain-containing protein [Bacillus infantis]|uniref:DUF4359 domain-containing protein n=1 Tax=Bacillus infantis TaxID=324767 RepID=A0A5D4SVS9_9BACI|nr:DUF4359 domain-containing protein [Bacillus infantis]TYS66388.1 DUF4359 domain-containing protein [Bacillus infantis]